MSRIRIRNRFRSGLAIVARAGLGMITLLPLAVCAQQLPIQAVADPSNHTVIITAGGIPFTTFWYPDTLEKPVLYPIYAPDGQLITRGFPVKPRPGEPTDHPHHLGLWFNYENVNGLDFWNNSYAIPAAKKNQYGWIRTDSVTTRAEAADAATLYYVARWTDQQQHTLLIEHTSIRFTATAHVRMIDRTTTLTAQTDVHFPDAKDGMLGLRVTRELQIPSNTPGEFIDDKGNITRVAAGRAPDINGNYLTSAGITGDSAWGTRGVWCMLYGKKGADTISVVMIDHPGNPGFPTYWHARGYGLFAANPLGQKVFSKGAQTLGFQLAKGQSATFRYRIVVAAGNRRLSTDGIRQLAGDFARLK
ncbi:MAG TPA: PmoA family protein [Puia sp.]|nr:PmoA family protein [Puia sp.]